jgi:hypothetical protein
MSGGPPNHGVEGGAQQQQPKAATPATPVQLPHATSKSESSACPETHQIKYDCNTVSAIANVRQAEAAEWFNHLAYAEIGIGLATAVIAVLAARWAKRAAKAARKALKQDRKRSAAELRPWVSVEVELTGFSASEHTLAIHYELVFANVGKTVANHFFFKSDSHWLAKLDAGDLDARFAKWTEPTELDRFAVIPGEKKRFFGSHARMKDAIPWTNKAVSFIVMASAFYRSPMDEKWHRTDRAFTIGRKDETSPTSAGFFVYEDMIGDDPEMLCVRTAYSGETT